MSHPDRTRAGTQHQVDLLPMMSFSWMTIAVAAFD
jgi:hypothetical protein